MGKQAKTMNHENELIFVPDVDFEDDDEYPEIDVAALEAELKAMMAENDATPRRTTILTDDGRRIGPAMMTAAERQTHLDALDAAAPSRLAYDANADVLHIRLQAPAAPQRSEIEPAIVFNFDADGNLVGVDVHRASRIVQQAVS